MKKKICIFLLLLFSWTVVGNAQEMNLYFNPNGGKPKTSGFTLNDNNGFIVYGSSAYATYKGGSTIKKINSISGKSFTLTKSGDSLVSGREWYLKNVNDGKIYYFSQSKTYKVKDILKKLSYEEDESFVSIDLYANWNSKPKSGGVDIDGGSDHSTKPNSMKLKTQKSSIMVGEKTTVTATFNPSGMSEKVSWSTSNKKVAKVSSSGVVTGVKKGTVTITGKSASGLKAKVKVKVTKVPSGTHYTIIQYHMNGGSLSSSHGKSISSSGSYILRNKSKSVHKIAYGFSTSKKGLADWDNKNFINITKNGYEAVSGKEWNTKPDGSGKSYGDHKVYKASELCDSSKKDCTVTLYVNWKKTSTKSSDIFTQDSFRMYKSRFYDLKQFVKSGTGKITWTSENKKLATVTSDGIVKAVGEGTVMVVAKTSSGEDKIKIIITSQTNDKSYNLTSCSRMDVKVTGSPVTLEDCIPDVDLKNPSTGSRHQIQGVSISDEYVYYSSPMNGAWLRESQGNINQTDDATTRKITTVYVARVPRSSSKMEYMQIEYAGHGQGLDTAGFNSEGKEILYVNLAAKFSDSTMLLNEKVVRGTKYRGVGITTFTGSTNKANVRHPGIVVAIKENFALSRKTSSAFKKNGSFMESSYYDYLKSLAKNDDYLANPETSVDEDNNRVAVRSRNQVIIYDEQQFRNGTARPIYTFKIENTGTQGDDIYGNYFYTITGMHDATIKKYDIRSGKKVAEAHIDFTEFLKDNAYVSMEPEGITFNNGKLYAGIVTRVCSKYSDGACSSKISYNTIAKISGI